MRRVAVLGIGLMATGLLPAVARGQSPAELVTLVTEARRSHPTLVAARRNARAQHEVPARAGSLPDPTLLVSGSNLRIDDPSLSGSPMSGIVVGIQQGIPFPGKLGDREEVARSAAQVLDADVEATEVQIALGVEHAYWALFYAERALSLTKESERVLNTLANAVHARFAVGEAAQQDALQAEVAHSELRSLVQEQEQAVRVAQRKLNRTVGRAPTRPTPPTQAPANAIQAKREALVAELLTRNPALRTANRRVALAARQLEEARYDRLPDLGLGVSYRFRAEAPGDMSRGADMISATLSVSLPVFMGGKQQARVRESALKLQAAQATRDDLALEITTSLHSMIDQLERLDAELHLYDEELLPEADQALDASIEDYQVGRVEFVSVLQNWRTQLRLMVAQQRLIAERAQTRASIRALVGEPLKEPSP